MKLVDGSFLIDYARGDDAALGYLAAHDEEAIGASTIVLSELYRGLMITQEMSQEEAMSNLSVSERFLRSYWRQDAYLARRTPRTGAV